MKLSEHFSLHEFTRSRTAKKLGIDNTPDKRQLENLKKNAKEMEKVRSLLENNPITPTSGFRSEELNEEINGDGNSYHLYGLATDFHCAGYGSSTEIVNKIKDSKVIFDQLIDEYGVWVHIGFPKSGELPRRQVLKAVRENGKVKYLPFEEEEVECGQGC